MDINIIPGDEIDYKNLSLYFVINDMEIELYKQILAYNFHFQKKP